MRDIAKNIRSLRTVRNLTQDELAEKLFVTRQTVSNYETGKSRPDVEMLARIAEVLETDVNTLIYGPKPPIQNTQLKSLIIGAVLTGAVWVAFLLLSPIALDYRGRTYATGPVMFLIFWLRPLACLFTGWTLAQMVGMALKTKPFSSVVIRWICIALIVLIILWLTLTLWYTGTVMINDFLFTNYLRGEWENGVGPNVVDPSWRKLPPPIPAWLELFASHLLLPLVQKWPYFLFLSGGCLWLTGFPLKKENEKESC